MAIEDVFSIEGRGTVGTGRIERGKVKLNETVDIVGLRPEVGKTVVTGIEMFRKLLDEGLAGDNVGLLLRGVDKQTLERGMVLAAPGLNYSAHQIQGPDLYLCLRKKAEGIPRFLKGTGRSFTSGPRMLPETVIFLRAWRWLCPGIIFSLRWN